MNVVFRLFEIVQPNQAFFGEKDYQQLAVIQKMVDELQLPVDIVPCETFRTSSGLAMSSRNMRLSPQGIQHAEIIFATLTRAKVLACQHTPKEVVEICNKSLLQSNLELEYLEITHPKKLTPLNDYWVEGARCFIAAYCESVRLIDNMVVGGC
jgi:pantoate--beta-alanine ligase